MCSNIFKEIIKKIISKKTPKRIPPQRRIKPEYSKQELVNLKANKLNSRRLPSKKGFFGEKIEKLVTLCLLNNFVVTKDFGPSDINKKFLRSFINSGYLIDGHLQIKASKSNSFGIADLFYFLSSSQLNILLIQYKLNKKNRTFKINKVYIVKLNFSFFIYLIKHYYEFWEFLSDQPNIFNKNSCNFNKHKQKTKMKKLGFFSFTHKKPRWQGNLNLIPLIKFLEQNKNHGSIDEIEIKNNSFTFCGININPLTLSY